MIQAKADYSEASANVRRQVESVIASIEKGFTVARAEQEAVMRSLGNTKGGDAGD